ncbi:MAG: hypothetical protein MJ145_04285 [Clostridia bacterium]|nr:hypothetical protein [Clostridia bacterium]
MADPTTKAPKKQIFYLTKAQVHIGTEHATFGSVGNILVNASGFGIGALNGVIAGSSVTVGLANGGLIVVWTSALGIYEKYKQSTYKDYYTQMKKYKYLKVTYTWNWHNGGKNSSWVRKSTPTYTLTNNLPKK